MSASRTEQSKIKRESDKFKQYVHNMCFIEDRSVVVARYWRRLTPSEIINQGTVLP